MLMVVYAECHYAKYCKKPLMQCVVLNAIMLSVANKPFTLCVVILNVIMPSVVVPL
jgi:hypothetical protein